MWMCIETRSGELHVIPEHDSVAHWGDRWCLCLPARVYQPGNLFGGGGYVMTHNSFDGREASEGASEDSATGNLESWSGLHDTAPARGIGTPHQESP